MYWIYSGILPPFLSRLVLCWGYFLQTCECSCQTRTSAMLNFTALVTYSESLNSVYQLSRIYASLCFAADLARHQASLISARDKHRTHCVKTSLLLKHLGLLLRALWHITGVLKGREESPLFECILIEQAATSGLWVIIALELDGGLLELYNRRSELGFLPALSFYIWTLGRSYRGGSSSRDQSY